MTSSATGRVAYIIKMFPGFSETFTLSELLELERVGVELQVYSLKQPNDERDHADVKDVKAPENYVSPVIWASITAYTGPLREVFCLNPWRYLQTGYIAPKLKRDGITHVPAHFASSATSVAHYLNQLMNMRCSFTAHV